MKLTGNNGWIRQACHTSMESQYSNLGLLCSLVGICDTFPFQMRYPGQCPNCISKDWIIAKAIVMEWLSVFAVTKGCTRIQVNRHSSLFKWPSSTAFSSASQRHNYFYSRGVDSPCPIIIRMTKSRRMWWAGRVAHKGQKCGTHCFCRKTWREEAVWKT